MRRFSSAEIFAVLVSIASVTISVLGNRTQERLLAASVWPYLSFASGNTSDDGQKQEIAIGVANSGNGPARIRDFGLEYDHHRVASGSDLLEQCCGMRPSRLLTSPIVGRVLRPGEAITLLKLQLTPDIAEGWHRLDKARFGFVLSACYCSTLNECWNIASDKSDPAPVERCNDTPREQQWHG